MANLTELEQWELGIYQLETTDVVEGGETGIDNLQPRQLANRTSWLKAQLTALGNLLGLHEAAADPHPQYLTAAEGDILVPPGTLIFTARNSAPPGFLKANGAALSRTTYAGLFSEIGTLWGVGDGVNTFNLPDFRGEFLRGFDDGRGVDVGRLFSSWQDGTWLRTVVQEWAGSDVTGPGPYSMGNAFSSADGEITSSGVGGATPDGSKTPAGSNYNNATTDNVVQGPAAIDAVATVNHWIRFRSRNLAPLVCIKY